MANKLRAERIFIIGDKGFRLRPTLQFLAELEGETGSSIAEMAKKIEGEGLSETDYQALEYTLRRNLRLEEQFSGRILGSFKKQMRDLLLDSFYELNPQNNEGKSIDELNIPWKELMHICVYHLKIPFEQFWNLTLPEAKILLQGVGGSVYSQVSPMEIKEMKEILKFA